MNWYEDKQEARRERYLELAEKNEQKSSDYYQQSKDISKHIPFGQPILVGHHSEKRHRRDLEKIDNCFRKSSESIKKAKYYQDKADSVGKGGISSDDPEAIAKLKKQLEEGLAYQERMKKANRAIRKGDDQKLLEMGYTSQQIKKLKEPDYLGRIGYPDYELTNNRQNNTRIKKRIEELEAASEREYKEYQPLPDLKVIENVEINRIQLIFDGFTIRPNQTKIKALWFPLVAD